MKQIFEIDQIVRHGSIICRVMLFEPANGKYMIRQEVKKYAWSAQWCKTNELKPIF